MINEASLVDRLQLLGIACDTVPTDRLTSQVAALACFPMYMVANIHAWTSDRQFSVPLVDLPGFEAIRESFAIGRQESKLEMSKDHRHLLSTLLQHAKPSDRVIYEYALDSLATYLETASPAIAQELRTAIARMIVAVAKASGEGLFGTGERVSRHEKECIDHIAARLNLSISAEAARLLADS